MANTKLLIIEGIHALLDELQRGSPQSAQLGRLGSERSAYEDSVYKGRLRHFSVSAKKNLQKDIINAIINKDGNVRHFRRRPAFFFALMRKKK